MAEENEEIKELFIPYPAQERFLTCPAPEALLEGNRGGGKSDALLIDYACAVNKGYGVDWTGILFRREYKHLEELVAKSRKYFHEIFPEAVFKASKSDYYWAFPEGERLYFRTAKDENDYYSYHGHQYPWIGYDELTTWGTSGFYDSMKSCWRTTNPNVPKRIRATTNPYGIGHAWVKEKFIDPAPREIIIYDGPVPRVAIHSDLRENKALLEADPHYIDTLANLSNEVKRQAWYEGSWDIVAGAFFSKSWGIKNIIEPFKIPKHWYKFVSFDWGYSKPFSVGWWAISDGEGNLPRGAMIRFREWYGCEAGEPDVGLQMTVEQVADGIKERTQERIDYYIADPAIFKNDGGESHAERFQFKDILFSRADNTRHAGWDLMRQRMEGIDGIPMFYVFNTCRDFIRTIPALLYDEKDYEDLDTNMEDHIADESRYAVMSRPWVKEKPPEKPKSGMTFDSLIKKKEQGYNII